MCNVNKWAQGKEGKQDLMKFNYCMISDLEYETEVEVTAPEPAQYETAYVTSHKANCRAGAFSCDGQLVATGSADSSIKVFFSC